MLHPVSLFSLDEWSQGLCVLVCVLAKHCFAVNGGATISKVKFFIALFVTLLKMLSFRLETHIMHRVIKINVCKTRTEKSLAQKNNFILVSNVERRRKDKY